ncbi:MAG: hypothetical protein RMY64_10650 [Nostoc sp. DedQUE08]|uniref:hypothetical protein n=2 Tax=Nostoc TaxID=1177 RepID=UPI002AD217D7|nr:MULTISPECIES: hypothetical protein [unclassified Nostoc]MDZ8066083.1 hypothetical protein [Nostoc sp. DedQUE08]MDZ8090507.1 hypothetical protein [Nostoc sp. DedQUE05]
MTMLIILNIPLLNDEFFEKAMLRLPATEAQNLIQIDPDMIAWFQFQGVEHKTLINSLLRQHIKSLRRSDRFKNLDSKRLVLELTLTYQASYKKIDLA